MYKIENVKLKTAMKRHEQNHSFQDEICFLKAMIEEAANECETSTEMLERLHKPIATLVSSIEKLKKLELANNDLIAKETLVELGRVIVAILSESLSLIPDQDLRNKIVDHVAPRIATAMNTVTN